MGVAVGQIVFGLIEAFFGRRLYWIFVALAGFAIGWELAPAVFGDLETWAWVLIGGALGVIFALLSIKFTKWMVMIAGFFASGPVAVQVVRWFGAEAAQGSASFWIAYIVGGIIGAILIRAFLQWGLIILTALFGAGATATGIDHFVPNQPRWLQILLFVVILVLGLWYQVRSYRKTSSASK